MDAQPQIYLKHGELKPSTISITLPTSESSDSASLMLQISKDQQKWLSDHTGVRKYFFIIEELDQQSDPITYGEQWEFKFYSNTQPGVYHLSCLNYPKLTCQVTLTLQETERMSNSMVNLTGLEAVEEQRQEQLKEDCVKEDEWFAKQEEFFESNKSPFGTPNKADYQDYDKILSVPEFQNNIQNRYRKYFQEQFKLWRTFFQQNELTPEKKLITPVKQKPKSEQRKNSDADTEQRGDNWSKRQHYSPHQHFTLSCGSPSNYQNFSEGEKQKSVGSLLYSHQGIHDRGDDELAQPKTMKKTNSQYRLNVEDNYQIKYSDAETTEKTKTKRQYAVNFEEWLTEWSSKKEPIEIVKKDDGHIVGQWLAHLSNKYRIAKFLYD